LYEKAVFLQDQATDFKELSEALTERNIELAAEVKSLTEQLKETKKGADEEKIIAKLTEEKERAERKLQATLKKTGKVNEALELRIKSLRKRLDEAVVTIDETSTKGEKVTKLVREKKSIESQLKQALKEEELNNKRIEEENKKLAETVQAVKEGRREALTDLEVLKIELTETKMKANKLARKNSILESKSALQEERAKKAEIRKNADIVALKEKIDEITKKAVDRTSITEAKREIIKMKKDTEKLNETNRVFEKQNGVLETQLKQAAELLVESKKIREAEKAKIVELAETNIQLKAANEKLLQETEALKEALAKTAEAFDNLAAEHTSYKEAVTNKINPIKNFQPKFETRVGQHLNFREGLGAGIEAYWGDLVAKYGENVTPYERHIRGAKTLQEATSAFLKFKDYIDPKFAQVHNSILDESAIHTKAQRAALLEAAGQPVYQEEISVEERNKIYLEKMRKQGFKF
jgi:chromosome segregation ATPase